MPSGTSVRNFRFAKAFKQLYSNRSIQKLFAKVNMRDSDDGVLMSNLLQDSISQREVTGRHRSQMCSARGCSDRRNCSRLRAAR
jgi:hypothetical protein